MSDMYVEKLTTIDTWSAGGEAFRLVNTGAGPMELQVKRKDSSIPESNCYTHGVLCHRIKTLVKG